ncbi:MAG TPA: isoprenylcysteine carboxylmethyltransferase family protein [Candidatus Kapabacteria bacterium]|nr:isoprenylcysteine carboxylmethyltransferase family protein [Candidatus Kapabacteria bacterium]
MPEETSSLSYLLSIVQWSPLHVVILLVIVQRILELRLSKRNEKRLRERGAVEVGADHSPAIVTLHALWFAGMIAEVVLLTRSINPFWPALLAILLLAQWLRYWAIRSLGPSWTTRVLVVPKSRPVTSGPYKYLRHPNYIVVATELFVLPVMLGAYVTAITVTVINAILLLIRIRAEDRAWREIGKR